MGRHCGWLAMLAGIAGGAEFILVPEEEYNLDDICSGIIKSYEQGRRYSLIVVAEGVGSSLDIGKYIEEKTNMDVRVSVLGHIQRGGSPSVRDRVKASQLGEKAALALIAGQSDVVFGFNQGKVVAIDLHDAITNKKHMNDEFIRLAKQLN
jgi:6-phosphofructokinase 1